MCAAHTEFRHSVTVPGREILLGNRCIYCLDVTDYLCAKKVGDLQTRRGCSVAPVDLKLFCWTALE